MKNVVLKLHYHSNQVVKKYFLGSGELIGAHHMSVHAVVRAKNAHPLIAMVAKKISSLIFASTQRACSRGRAHMVHARVGHREIRFFTWPVRRRRKEMFWDYLIGNTSGQNPALSFKDVIARLGARAQIFVNPHASAERENFARFLVERAERAHNQF